jgi:membrane protease YdiL (CAAX protease family)
MRKASVAEHRERHVEKVLTAHRSRTRWAAVAALEVALAAAVVILDVGIPTFVILALMTLSLLIRRQGLSTLGLRRVAHPWPLVATTLALAAGWTLVNIGLLKPIENHLTGTRQDMSQFTSLQGNLRMLLVWVALAWVVAALGETLAFIGFIQTRIADVIGSTGVRLAVAVVLSSVLLGLLHTEYGIVGVLISAVDGIFYSLLRYRYHTLWAPILAHGFIDTIGFVSFFLVGPVYGLW